MFPRNPSDETKVWNNIIYNITNVAADNVRPTPRASASARRA